MKTTNLRVGRVEVRLNRSPEDAGRLATDVARRVAEQIEVRSGVRLPANATRQLAGRITRALADGGRR